MLSVVLLVGGGDALGALGDGHPLTIIDGNADPSIRFDGIGGLSGVSCVDI